MKEKVAQISITANMVLAGLKITAGIVSGSAAVAAEGLHSFTDIFSSLISYWGIRAARKPADTEHPYGHYKFEALAGAVITLIVFGTGWAIIYQAYRSFFSPEPIITGGLAFGIMVLSAVANEVMARVKIHYGKKEGSSSLLSDGIHSRIDVFTSVAVLAGLWLNHYWIYADAALAFLIGLYIIKESLSVGKEAVDSLLDASAGTEVEAKIKSIVQSQNVEISFLKTQKKGSIITANLEIGLPHTLKVEEATAVTEKLRDSLMRAVPRLRYVAIQITSHDTQTGYYKSGYGRGFGWQHRGTHTEQNAADGRGPSGHCVCPQCNYTTQHQRGIPCSSLRCPRCDTGLKREDRP
jgi:cation diffusion facilitator family transporter